MGSSALSHWVHGVSRKKRRRVPGDGLLRGELAARSASRVAPGLAWCRADSIGPVKAPRFWWSIPHLEWTLGAAAGLAGRAPRPRSLSAGSRFCGSCEQAGWSAGDPCPVPWPAPTRPAWTGTTGPRIVQTIGESEPQPEAPARSIQLPLNLRKPGRGVGHPEGSESCWRPKTWRGPDQTPILLPVPENLAPFLHTHPRLSFAGPTGLPAVGPLVVFLASLSRAFRPGWLPTKEPVTATRNPTQTPHVRTIRSRGPRRFVQH